MINFWRNKKVVVAGGRGFIGSHVVRQLYDKGAKVKVLTSYGKKKPSELEKLKNIEFIRCDLMDLNEVIKATKEQAFFLNFAGMDGGISFKNSHSAEIFRVNSQITLNILEASRLNKIDKTLLMSSIEVFSLNDQSNGYVWSKKFIEESARLYSEQFKMKVLVARPGNTYGTGDTLDPLKIRVIPSFILKARANREIVISSSQKFSFLFVDDLAKALLEFIEHEEGPDPINFISSEYFSLKEVAKKIINITKSKSKLVEKTRKQKPLSKKLKSFNLGLEIKLEHGLKKTIDWIKNVN